MKPIESVTCPGCGVEFRRDDVPPNHLCPVCGAHLFGTRPAAPDPETPPPKPLSVPRAWERPIKIALGLLAVGILALGWHGHSILEEGRARRQAQAAAEDATRTAGLDPGQCVTNGGYFAAVSEEVLDRVTTYQGQGDFKAIGKLMDAGLAFKLAAGKTVYADQSWGKARIRVPGEVAELWTYREAVTCK